MRRLKDFVKSIPLVGGVARSVYGVFYKLWNYQPQEKEVYHDTPTAWIESYLEDKPLDVVQIGSNDGMTGDPIFDLIRKNGNWRVTFVEPVPYLFEKLKQNYSYDTRFRFERAAINDGSEQIFYSVRPEAKEHIPDLPDWYEQLGSFYKENILYHLNGVLEPYMEETVIKGMTLSQLFEKNDVTDLQLLHIDTEGYDWKVLSKLDLSKYKPAVILFEHKHLKRGERKASIKFLKKDYYIFALGADSFCLRKDVPKDNSWNGLQGKLMNP